MHVALSENRMQYHEIELCMWFLSNACDDSSDKMIVYSVYDDI